MLTELTDKICKLLDQGLPPDAIVAQLSGGKEPSRVLQEMVKKACDANKKNFTDGAPTIVINTHKNGTEDGGWYKRIFCEAAIKIFIKIIIIVVIIIVIYYFWPRLPFAGATDILPGPAQASEHAIIPSHVPGGDGRPQPDDAPHQCARHAQVPDPIRQEIVPPRGRSHIDMLVCADVEKTIEAAKNIGLIPDAQPVGVGPAGPHLMPLDCRTLNEILVQQFEQAKRIGLLPQ
ncbi:MAG: hypothetical protein WC630_01360 [Candidatus Babeliales bacterium]|jgi:hypothetical protein